MLAQSVTEPRQLPKRAACDRCRNQKLRCLRVQGNLADACIRCVQSHVECVSSSSKRPGRPRNSTNATRQGKELNPTPNPNPQTTPTTTTTVPTVTAISCHDPNPTVPALTVQPLGSVDSWFSLRGLEQDYDMGCVDWNSVDFTFPLEGPGTAKTTSSICTPPETSTLVTVHDLTAGKPLSQQSLSMQPVQGDTAMADISCQQSIAPDNSHGLQLIAIQCDLSEQLFTLESMPWDVTKVMQVTFLQHSAGSPNTDQPSDLEVNPLAKIAKTCADFTRFLRSVQAPLRIDGDVSAKNPGALSSVHPRLTITDLLTIISCHILTISIYDTIFSYFTKQALQNPAAVQMAMESVPKLLLGGISVPPRLDMLSHLLWSLASSQVQPIEVLLGLPEDCCISAKLDSEDGKAGLFSGESGQLLFAALRSMEEERVYEGRCGLGVIKSLRQKIKTVLGLR